MKFLGASQMHGAAILRTACACEGKNSKESAPRMARFQFPSPHPRIPARLRDSSPMATVSQKARATSVSQTF